MEAICREITIAPRDAGRRLDVFLSDRFSRYSRSEVARHILEGLVKTNDRPLKPSTTLRAGQILKIYIPGLAPTEPPPSLPEILLEDERIMVVNKPPGMLVHPAGDFFEWALIGLFRSARLKYRVDLAHRLDRDTSGVIVLTKDTQANIHIKDSLAKLGAVRKRYLAIVSGRPEWETVTVERPIGKAIDSRVNLRKGINPAGQKAITTFTVVKRLKDRSLIACRLLTGRTHQIRVHLESLGHPIWGDKLYGRPDSDFLEYLDYGWTPRLKATIPLPRHALHAYEIAFPHPNGGVRRVRAPLPEDMSDVIGLFDPLPRLK